MLFGVALPNFGELADRDALVTLARSAEALGYDSIWLPDHLLLPREAYAGLDSLEALTVLGLLAGRTNRVRLGTSVLVTPLREPVLLAKQAATVQELSGGRLTLGLGVGWLEAEFDLMGVDFATRGHRADAIIETLAAPLTASPPHTTGRLEQVRATFSPRVSRDLPLVIGGNSPAAQRRSVRYGDGWHAVWLEPHEVAAATRGLRACTSPLTFGAPSRHITRTVLPSGHPSTRS